MLIKCSVEITPSFKTAYDFLIDFFQFLPLDLNQPTLAVRRASNTTHPCRRMGH